MTHQTPPDWPYRLRLAGELLLMAAAAALAVGVTLHNWTWVAATVYLIIGSCLAAFGSHVAHRLEVGAEEIRRAVDGIGGQR